VGVRVELFRDAAESQGRDLFSCPAELWELLVELGETFGWRPLGTTYLVPPKSKVVTPARQNYQAGSAQDYKRVEAQDAIAWAGALDGAKRSPHFIAMVSARSAAIGGGSSEAALLSLIDEFIQYVYGGAFTFAALPADDRQLA
jgi:hypothetical protein